MYCNKLCLRKTVSTFKNLFYKNFSTSHVYNEKYQCKLLVVGCGTGGCAVAAKFSRNLTKNELIIIEPSKSHYYQPLFTLVGGGIHSVEDARRNTKDIQPKNSTLIQTKAVEYFPKKNQVLTENNDLIEYDYLLLAVGLETRYDKIPGLEEALHKPGGVCSNYSYKYVDRTYKALQNLKSGNAIFTFPATAVKCPGAPQKICYITDDYLRKAGLRNNVNIMYNTSLPVLFGVKTYADALWKVCEQRGIQVNTRTNLVRVDCEKEEATFENLDKPEEKNTYKYSMLHVTPPMFTPESLSKNKDLTNEAGFVNVNKFTLQHVSFPNIFAIGDCSSSPNSKTAAAAAAQCEVVYQNMKAVMDNSSLPLAYDGYASCPLVTGYDKCILAEFDYDLKPLETFPFRQDKELKSMFLLKKDVMPSIYWLLMMNGKWNGPAFFRNLMHLNFRSKNKVQ